MSKELNELIAKVEAALAEDATTTEAQTRAFADAQAQIDARVSEMAQKLEEATRKAEALERQLELQVVSQTMEDIHSFADGLVTEGKLPPALKDKVVTLLSVQANLEGEVKAYALGDAGDVADETPFKLLMDVLGALPVQGQFKGVKKDAKAGEGLGEKRDVRRYANDIDAATEMHARIRQVQQERGVSYMQAFEAVKKEAIEAQG